MFVNFLYKFCFCNTVMIYGHANKAYCYLQGQTVTKYLLKAFPAGCVLPKAITNIEYTQTRPKLYSKACVRFSCKAAFMCFAICAFIFPYGSFHPFNVSYQDGEESIQTLTHSLPASNKPQHQSRVTVNADRQTEDLWMKVRWCV